MSFTQTDYEALLTQLNDLRDERYRLFNEKLIPGKQNTTLGVRMPLPLPLWTISTENALSTPGRICPS